MRWSTLETLGRIVHPFFPTVRGSGAPADCAVSQGALIQPLHVERAHARVHPVHTEARKRRGTEFIVSVPRPSQRLPES